MRCLQLAALVLSFAMCVFAQQSQPGQPTSPSAPPETSGGTQTTASPKAPVGDTSKVTSGWRTVQDKQGLCQWDVPGGWYAIEPGNESLIQYAQGKAAASLHHNPMKTWEQFREHIKQNYRPTKILEDGADRIWFHYSKGKGGIHTYVARPAGTQVCAAQIDVTDSADLKHLAPVVEHLAQSVGPAKAGSAAQH